MIALVDANNFFVSCERAVNPRLSNRPVVVLSSNDGCVISRSNEAKDLGIPMGAPYFKYRDLMNQNKVAVYSVNFDLYQHFSRKIFQVLSANCRQVQQYSIDECFVKIPSAVDLIDWAINLRAEVYQVTAIPVSIGVSYSKTLTKIAASKAKEKSRNQESEAVCVLPKDEALITLESLSIGSVWGIGPRLANRMRHDGIKTAGNFIERSDSWIRARYGIVGLRLKYELIGLSTSEVREEQSGKKGISATKSFGKDVFDYQSLKESLITHLQTATRKLRRQSAVAGKVSIFIRTGKHKTGSQYYGKTFRTLLVPTNNLLHFSALIDEMLSEVYREGYKYYRSGVFLSEITSAENYVAQDQLLSKKFSHEQNVMKVMDSLQLRYGQNAIRIACVPYKPNWAARSQFKSFTQDLRDINKLPKLHLP